MKMEVVMAETTKIQWARKRGAQTGQAAQRTGCLTVEEWQGKRDAGLNWCIRCREWRPAERFNIDRSRMSGLQQYCRDCNRVRHIEQRYKLPNNVAAKLRAVDVCAICGRSGVAMEVDHDHATGKVRGVLCSRCNGALGQFCDDILLLQKAIAYVENHEDGS